MAQKRAQQLEERKREERVGELRNVAGHKQGLTNWRGGRGRSGLVSSETWEVTNKDSRSGGEGEGGGRRGDLRGGRTHKKNKKKDGRKRGEGEEENGKRRGGRRKRTKGREKGGE